MTTPTTPAAPAQHASRADPRLQARIERLLIDSPLGRKLGVQLADLAPEHAVIRLPFDASNVTVGEMVHGGAIASLIDIAGAAGAASNVDPEGQQGGVTSAMTVNYLAAARAADLLATARVIQRSSRRTVTEVDVHTAGGAEPGTLVAKGIVTSRLF